MSVNVHDPRPQATIRTSGGSLATEPRGAYVDQGLTKRNDSPTPDAILPARSGSTTLGEVTIYDIPTVNHEPGDQGAVVPPHSPNSWTPDRDYYTIDGMPGQDFFKNQG